MSDKRLIRRRLYKVAIAVVALFQVLGCTNETSPEEGQQEPPTPSTDEGSVSQTDPTTQEPGAPGSPDYGPLIVVDLPAIPDSEALLGEGEIVLTEECVALETDADTKLLVWEAATVAWSDGSIEVQLAGVTTSVSNGDRVTLGGTAFQPTDATYVQPPSPSCDGELSLVTGVTVLDN